MINTLRYKRAQEYFQRVQRDSIINVEENTNATGNGDRRVGIVGTVGTLQTGHLNEGQ